MLKINNQEYKLLKSEVKYAKAVRNKLEGYTTLVLFDIELNNMKGYVSFYVDFFANKDFKNIVNKEYIEFPNKLDSKISMIEIFDTKKRANTKTVRSTAVASTTRVVDTSKIRSRSYIA